MNASEFHQAWACLLDSMPIDEQQATGLLERVERDLPMHQTLADDLAIHRVLRLLHEPDDMADSFVEDCLQQIRGLEPQKEHAPVKHAPGIETGIETGIDTGIDTGTSTAKPDVILKAEQAIRRKRRNAKWVMAAMSMAVAVLIGCFVVVWQNNAAGPNSTERDRELNQPPGSVEQAERVVEGVDLVDGGKSESENGAAVESPGEAGVELPSLPETDNSEQLAGGGDEPAFDMNSTVGWLEFSDTTIWDSGLSPQPGLIKSGRYQLDSGFAVVLLRGQKVLVARGPASFEIVSDENVSLESGEFLIESAVASSPLAIDSRDFRIGQLNSTVRVRLRVDGEGSEVLLLDGELSLARKVADDREVLALKSDELNRAFVNNLQVKRTVPGDEEEMLPVVVAAGPTKFFAQMGVGEEKKTSSSPGEFSEALEQHAAGENRPLDELERFNQLFDEIRQQFNDSGETPAGFSLRSQFQNDDRGELNELRARLRDLMKK